MESEERAREEPLVRTLVGKPIENVGPLFFDFETILIFENNVSEIPPQRIETPSARKIEVALASIRARRERRGERKTHCMAGCKGRFRSTFLSPLINSM